MQILTKEEVLQQIKLLSAQQVLRKKEMLAAYEEGSRLPPRALPLKLGIAAILYYLGGAIVFLGIAILLAQHWSALNTLTKISATLGAAIAAYYTGLLFTRDRRTVTVGSAFFVISALVMPLGLYVVFNMAGYDAASYGLNSLIAAMCFAIYALSFAVFRKPIFILFSVIFGTCLFFNFNYFLLGNNPYFPQGDFYAYLILITGLCYLLLGYYFSQSKDMPFLWFFYGFGIIYFLSAALFLGGWKPEQKIVWELAFPLLAFGGLFFSVHLKSKALLVFSTIFLMIYIFKITAEYFSDSLGWPLVLVMGGLLMIAAGYLSLSLHRKYLQ